MDTTTAHPRRPRSLSRPTTPLRASSRSSVRDVACEPTLAALDPQLAEFADSMADLEANFMHLQLMHESLTRFNECFSSFLYGMNMNAFCVDFPEACSALCHCRHHHRVPRSRR